MILYYKWKICIINHFLSFLSELKTLLNRFVAFLSYIILILLFLIIKSDTFLYLLGYYLMKFFNVEFLKNVSIGY
jgi:hypothetical protein